MIIGGHLVVHSTGGETERPVYVTRADDDRYCSMLASCAGTMPPGRVRLPDLSPSLIAILAAFRYLKLQKLMHSMQQHALAGASLRPLHEYCENLKVAAQQCSAMIRSMGVVGVPI